MDTARERLALESRNYNAVEMRAITTALLPPLPPRRPALICLITIPFIIRVRVLDADRTHARGVTIQ